MSDHTPSQRDRERILRSRPGRSFFKNHTVESDLIYLTFRRVYTLEIC
jgi:hypothetical protein